ncbi:transcriptional regulator [bacterium]|nr:MAG: transcriptional regulator [bacterium]
MIKSIDELQRQIEIVAFVFEHPDKYSEIELAEHFFTSDTSIRRDMKALREMGIVIHSRKHSYRIELTQEQVNQLVTAYFAFGNNETIKNLPLVFEKFQKKTLTFFVQTIKAIREKTIMEIEYRAAKNGRLQWRSVTPVTFYNAGKTHYLIAMHHETPKMFTLERINAFRFTGQRSAIKNVPSLGELFKYSWGSFTGGAITKVRLLFQDEMEQYMSEKFWVENQEVKQTDDGFEVTMQVKLSNEFVAWIMGWGSAVRILEPKELVENVLNKAKAITEKYSR